MRHLTASLLLSACFTPGQPACDDDIPPVAPGVLNARLAAVNDWTYQLQGRRGDDIDLRELTGTAYDLAVIDYSRDGSAAGEFRAEEIAAAQAGGRLVLAYVSIGEAEDFRFYFDALPPELLASQNPDFRDDFKVNFCDPRWRELIIGPEHAPGASSGSYLDRILDAGFDGAYLDIIEAYLFFTPGCAQFCEDECEGATAAEDMSRFVQDLAAHARVVHGRSDFLVVPQNQPEIITRLADGGAAYLSAIDAIGQEDTFFFEERDTLAVNGDLDPQCDEVIPNLDAFLAAGKLVFSVDYLTQEARIDDFYARAERRGYVPYAAPSRELDAIAIPEGHAPD